MSKAEQEELYTMLLHNAPRWILILAVGLSLLLVGPIALSSAQTNPERPVMAFYYPWYEMTDWSYDKMSDLPVPQYSGGDDETIRRHIQQADDAGIDALICAWYGPNETRLNARCRRLQELAASMGRDLKIAIMPEQAAWADLNNVDNLVNALEVLETDFMSQPNYLRFQGKPAVFWFNPPSLGGVDTWLQVRNRADPNREHFWFGGTDNAAYLDVYDTLYFFDITWERFPGHGMESYANLLEGTGRPFIATAMPGYDDLRIRNGHQRSRENGNYYRGTWEDAVDHNADGVVITSFNEFFEGTHIEPSEQYGDLYLRLTGEMTAYFRDNVGQQQPATPAPRQGRCRTFTETGYDVCGRLLEYWEQNDGLRVFGLPVTPQREELIEGRPYQVQWFERNRLELHPENAPPYDVLLGRLGAEAMAQSQIADAVPASFGSDCMRLPDAQHDVCGPFLRAWRASGLALDGRSGVSESESLALFGLPVGPPRTEVIEGQVYTVQWFERARFEYHPENAAPYDVLFGLLGNELLAAEMTP
jgi:hypothetical protein